MKFSKNILLVITIIVIIFALNSRLLSNPFKTEPKEVTFSEMVNLIKGHPDYSFDISESDNGRVILVANLVDTYATNVNPNNSPVMDLVQAYNLNYKPYSVSKSLVWSLLPFLILAFFVILIINQFMTANKLKKVSVNRVPDFKMEDVGGLSLETKSEINQAIDILKNPSRATDLGIKAPKGILLEGPPGTGKTILAKAIANELGANFFSTNGSAFMEMYVGVGAKRIRELFVEARNNAKPVSVVFIDEIDTIAGKRKSGPNQNQESEGTLNQLLSELNDKQDGVFFIAATNRKDMLDEAFIRPGRIDYQIHIGLPDLRGRQEIIEIHSRSKRLAPEVISKLSEIAASTTGYSGADLEGLFENAAKKALMSNRSIIDMSDVNYAIDRMILGSENRPINNEKTKQKVAYHEAGHALVQSLIKPGSVRKATIIPRGNALGFMAPIQDEMHLSTESDLMAQIQVTLAGGVAETKVYGEHSLGVSGDIQQVKRIIENMVDHFGMGQDAQFSLSFSAKEKEVIMTSVYQKALAACKSLIDQHSESFERLAHALMEKETLSGDEIHALVHGTSDI